MRCVGVVSRMCADAKRRTQTRREIFWAFSFTLTCAGAGGRWFRAGFLACGQACGQAYSPASC